MARLSCLWALVLAAACDPGSPTLGDVALDPGNTDGARFETPAFDVAQGAEIQDCYFLEMPDLAGGADYFIDRVRLGTNSGSHHMNVFRVKTILALGRPED